MEITLYKYSKRINSTERPEANATAVRSKLQLQNVKINFTTDVTNLDIVLSPYKDGDYVSYCDYNYCYVPFFSRYYWIREWQYSTGGLVIARAQVDPLASFVEFISGGRGYINRSSDPALANEFVVDTLYPATANYRIVDLVTIRNEFSARPGAGTFIIGVLGKNTPVYGAINYYKVTQLGLNTIIDNMLYNSLNPSTSADAWKISGISDDLLKSIVSPIQYIVSCKWYPIFDYPTQHVEPIYLGTWNTGATGEKIVYNENSDDYQYRSFNWIVNVPRIASTDPDYAKYRKYPPYATYSIYNSMMGMFTVDPVLCASRDKLAFSLDINYASGEARFTCRATADAAGDIEHDALNVVFSRSFKIGIGINLTQIATDYVNLAKSAVSVVGNTVNSFINPFSAATSVTAAVTSAIDAVKFAMSPEVTSISGDGNAFWKDIDRFRFIGQFQLTIPPAPAEFGYPVERPVSDTETLFDFWFHYVQCTDFHPDPNSVNNVPLKNEYDIIIEYLRKGVFLD